MAANLKLLSHIEETLSSTYNSCAFTRLPETRPSIMAIILTFYMSNGMIQGVFGIWRQFNADKLLQVLIKDMIPCKI